MINKLPNRMQSFFLVGMIAFVLAVVWMMLSGFTASEILFALWSFIIHFLFIATAFAFVVFNFVIIGMVGYAFYRSSQFAEDRAERRKNRRAMAVHKARRSIEGQLTKPDFESRLNSFLTSNKDEEDEEFVSKMKFWQRDQQYEVTPTRPIEYIRHLLQRISKLVSQR